MTNKDITIIENEITPVVAAATAITITDSQSLNEASTLRAQIKTAIDYVKEKKEIEYRPAKTVLDNITARFKPYEKNLDTALKTINDKMTEYQTAIFKAQKEKEAAIAARIGEGKGKLKVETAINQMANIEQVEQTEDTNFYNKPVLVIKDPSLIPREYCIPDEALITMAIKEGITVPGAVMEDRLVPRSR